VFIWAHSAQKLHFGTIRDSQTPENLTPESGVGVGVGVDFFLGVGSGSGLPQMLSWEGGQICLPGLRRQLLDIIFSLFSEKPSLQTDFKRRVRPLQGI
jgi:hypothetical protein